MTVDKNGLRAQELLAALIRGDTAPRPKRPTPEPTNGACGRCGAYSVVWATLPSGSRAPLDRHPEGPLVLRNGLAVEAPPEPDEPRFVLHFESCKKRQEKGQ